RIGKQFLLRRIAVDEVFYPSKQHFHEYRLRAGPAAEHAAKNDGEQGNEHDKDDHAERKYEEVLRPENLPKQDELPLHDVNKKQWMATDLQKRQSEKYDQVGDGEGRTQIIKLSFRLLRKNP